MQIVSTFGGGPAFSWLQCSGYFPDDPGLYNSFERTMSKFDNTGLEQRQRLFKNEDGEFHGENVVLMVII